MLGCAAVGQLSFAVGHRGDPQYVRERKLGEKKRTVWGKNVYVMADMGLPIPQPPFAPGWRIWGGVSFGVRSGPGSD